ncbi:MAG: hypothetical protein J5966_08435, partial [Lachnospiraceae bacterium]|nr:hypothetical protein [Lachnospiraceae bacterium]
IRRVIGSLPEDGHLVFRVEPDSIRWGKDNASVSVGGYLVQARADGSEIKFSGYSVGSALRDDVFPKDMLTTDKREALMLSFAVGKAESNAYYNAGIGAEYKNPDTFDLEKFEENIPAAEPTLPDPVSDEPKKKGKKKTAEKVIDTTVPEPAVIPETPEKEEEIPDAETKPVKDNMLSIEEARKMVADQGNLSGKTLGEIADNPATRRNLVWLSKQSRTDDGLNEALRVVINSIPSLVEFMKRQAS